MPRGGKAASGMCWRPSRARRFRWREREPTLLLIHQRLFLFRHGRTSAFAKASADQHRGPGEA